MLEVEGGPGAQPPPFLIPDRISRTSKGSALSSSCPRGGFIWLHTMDKGNLITPTFCKTWKCVGCRDRLLNLFKMRVEAGVLGLGRCVFITITYKMGKGLLRDATSVKEDWKEFWRRLTKSGFPKLKWLRVIELTKQKQPHLHVVMEWSLAGEARCYGVEFDYKAFRRRFDSCNCLSHTLARVWYAVTKDSWMVHVMPVLGAAGAAAYLGKYMVKNMMYRKDLEDAGFTRRWSSSRGWPGSGRVRLKQSGAGGGMLRKDGTRSGWWDIRWSKLYDGPLGSKNKELEEKVGNEWLIYLQYKHGRRAQLTKLGGFEHVQDVGA